MKERTRDADLTRYLPDDPRSWIPDYAERIGWDRLADYYHRVIARLLEMEPGDEWDVVRTVSPDRYDLFLHCARAAVVEAEHCTGRSYYIENRATLILCR